MRRRIDDPSRGDPTLTVPQAIVSAVQTGGLKRGPAARWAGIDPSTLSHWVERGVAEINRVASEAIENPDADYHPDEAPYAQLAEDLLFAEAANEMEAVLLWRQAMAEGRSLTVDAEGNRRLIPDWRACAEFLSRRHPDPWAARPSTTIIPSSAPDGASRIGPPIPASIEQAEALAAQLSPN